MWGMDTSTTENGTLSPDSATTTSAPADAGAEPSYGDPGDETGALPEFPGDADEGASTDGSTEKPFDLSELPGIGAFDQQGLVAAIQKDIAGNAKPAQTQAQQPAAPSTPAASPLDALDTLIKDGEYTEFADVMKSTREAWTQQQSKHAETEARLNALQAFVEKAERQTWEAVGDKLAEAGFERQIGKSGARSPAQQAFMRYIEHGTKLLYNQYAQFTPADKIDTIEIAQTVARTLVGQKARNPMTNKVEQVARTAKAGQALRRPAPSASNGKQTGEMTDEERMARGEAEFNARRAQLLGRK